MHARTLNVLAILLGMLLLMVSLVHSDDNRQITYKKYTNARFGYEISYPENLLLPQGEADNDDGQRFLSPDKQVEMLVWGSNNALGETIASSFKKNVTVKTKETPPNGLPTNNSKETHTFCQVIRIARFFIKKQYTSPKMIPL